MKKLLLFFMLILLLPGCSSQTKHNTVITNMNTKKEVSNNLINPSNVLSLQVNKGLPSPQVPNILISNQSADKEIINKVIGWINSSNIIGNEKSYGRHGYPTSININLKNGESIFIEPAFNINFGKNKDGSTWLTATPIEGQIVFELSADGVIKKRIKLKSNKVYDWLKKDWNSDIKLVPRKSQ